MYFFRFRAISPYILFETFLIRESKMDVHSSDQSNFTDNAQEDSTTFVEQIQQNLIEHGPKLKDSERAEFKKPQLLIGPQRGKQVRGENKIKLSIRELTSNIHSEPVNEAHQEESKDCQKEEVPKNVNNSKQIPPVPYKEPDWGGVPTEDYKLEVSLNNLNNLK